MKKKEFDELILSVKQAGRIRRGELQASRWLTLKPSDFQRTKGAYLRRQRSRGKLPKTERSVSPREL